MGTENLARSKIIKEMANLEHKLPPTDWAAVAVEPFRSQDPFEQGPQEIIVTPNAFGNKIQVRQEFLANLGYTERWIYLRYCQGLDPRIRDDGNTFNEQLVVNSLGRTLPKWDKVIDSEVPLHYRVNRRAPWPEHLDEIEAGHSALIEALLPERSRSPERLARLMHNVTTTNNLLSRWYSGERDVDVVTRVYPEHICKPDLGVLSELTELDAVDDAETNGDFDIYAELVYHGLRGFLEKFRIKFKRHFGITDDYRETDASE